MSDHKRVGVYARLSEDRDGQQTATTRQIADAKEFAERRGWEVADVFEDVDVSGFKRVIRPEFDRMLTALHDRQIDGVVVWKVDRLSRQQRDLVRVMDACEVSGAFVASVVDGVDTNTPTGQFIAELLVSQARMESKNSSIRQARKAEELAKAGRPSLGGSRHFGYSRDRQTVIEPEATLIREAADRVLAGESIRGVCRDWERRGILSPSGKPWQPSPLRRLLMSATISGQREYGGVVVASGGWPPIVSPDTTRRLRAVLSQPQRRLSPGPGRRYLLSGFLRCGPCGQALVARPRIDRVPRYVCARRPGHDACGKLAVLAEPLDDLITESVLLALSGQELREALAKRHAEETDDDLPGRIRDDEAALEEVARDHYAERRISRAEFFAARDAINARLEANRARLASQTGNGVTAKLLAAGADIRQAWADATLEWRRAVIAAVVDRVDVGPAVRGRNRFDPERVNLVWRF